MTETASREAAALGAETYQPMTSETVNETEVLDHDQENSTKEPEDVATKDADTDKASEAPPLSKNQQKKLARKQRHEETRAEFKAKRKEKTKAAKIRKRAAEAAQKAENPTQQLKTKPVKLSSEKVPVTIIFDCQFEDLMTENELISLASQITRCYSDNRKARYKAQLAVSSFSGKFKERFDTVLNKSHENWNDVSFFEGDFVDAAECAKEVMTSKLGGRVAGALSKALLSTVETDNRKAHTNGDHLAEAQDDAIADVVDPADAAKGAVSTEHAASIVQMEQNEQANMSATSASQTNDAPHRQGEIVYLTSDSPNTLHELKPYSTYIIGGIVDKNRHKGICYKTACDREIKTSRLPIGDYLKMQSRKVLTTNHVNEIMLSWLETGDWGEAMMKVMPKRKGGELRTQDDDAEHSD